MQSFMLRFKDQCPVVFGGLVFLALIVSGILATFLAGSLFVELTCNKARNSSSWAGMNDFYFILTTSPLLLLWSGFTAYCAMKYKPANTVAWGVTTLFLYGFWFYSRLDSAYCN